MMCLFPILEERKAGQTAQRRGRKAADIRASTALRNRKLHQAAAFALAVPLACETLDQCTLALRFLQ